MNQLLPSTAVLPSFRRTPKQFSFVQLRKLFRKSWRKVAEMSWSCYTSTVRAVNMMLGVGATLPLPQEMGDAQAPPCISQQEIGDDEFNPYELPELDQWGAVLSAKVRTGGSPKMAAQLGSRSLVMVNHGRNDINDSL